MPRTKTASDRFKEHNITKEDLQRYREHMSKIRVSNRKGKASIGGKRDEDIDEFAAAAKWKEEQVRRTNLNQKRAAKRKQTAKRSQHSNAKKRKTKDDKVEDEPVQVSEDGSDGTQEATGDSNAKSSDDDDNAGDSHSEKEASASGSQEQEASHSSESAKSQSSKSKKSATSISGEEDGSGDDENDAAMDEKDKINLRKLLKKRLHRICIPDDKAEFNSSKLERYQDLHANRTISKMSRLKLDTFDSEFKFALSHLLAPYKNLVELSVTYSDSVVRVFYSNFRVVNEILRTVVRGKKIVITPKKITNWLGLKSPQDDDSEFTESEVYKTLMNTDACPSNPVLKPALMPDAHRVLWYIYSRNFVNKGGHYTAFTPEDKENLTQLIKGKPIVVGNLIYDNMIRAATDEKRNTHLPFPFNCFFNPQTKQGLVLGKW